MTVPFHDPEVITPLFKITPDIDEAFPGAVKMVPPIPTPPATINAPVIVEKVLVVE